MDNNDKKEFVILWIEDQLLAIKPGVDLLVKLLGENFNREIKIIESPIKEDALKYIVNLKSNIPDLILLDIILPNTRAAYESNPPRVDMNAGYFIWDKIRKQDAYNDVPIIVITARANPLFRDAMEGRDKKLKWLNKPIGPSEVAEEILKVCTTNLQRTVQR